MRVHECIQGTSRWLQLRSGIPTASAFDMILTPKGKESTQAPRYLHTLLAERMMGHPVIEAVSTWMNRGNQLEAEAIAYYELQRGLDTQVIGFLTNDEGTAGASPDRFVGEEGIVEIKVPKEHVHVSYLLYNAADREYYPQLQGQMWISGRKWVDIMSYHPEMPAAIVRVNRDEDYIKLLSAAVTTFSETLEATALMLIDRGILEPGKWRRPTDIEEPKQDDGSQFFLTDADLEAILKQQQEATVNG